MQPALAPAMQQAGWLAAQAAVAHLQVDLNPATAATPYQLSGRLTVAMAAQPFHQHQEAMAAMEATRA